MNPAPAPSDPQRPPDGAPRARWSTPGLSDGLGDRMLMFDHGTATLLEVLRFKREFGDSPAFETALRERVERLRHLLHPSLAVIRGVENLAGGDGLALVSKQTAGRRLSDLLPEARGAVFAIESIRQLTPALSRLHQSGEGFAHGALTADRIVVTREGRLVIVEHVLGSALHSLHLPAARLRSDIGVAAPPTGEAPLDARGDVVQLGLIALSLLLGRKLDPAEYPGNIPARLDEIPRTDADATQTARLRRWLERALQIDPRPFQTAQEAHDAFGDGAIDAAQPAPAPEASRPDTTTHTPPLGIPSPAAAVSEPAAAPAASALPRGEEHVPSAPVPPMATPPKPAAVAAVPATAVPVMETVAIRPVAPVPPAPSPVLPVPQPAAVRPSPSRTPKWLLAALALAAAGEAVVIAGLLYARPATIVVETKAPQVTSESARPTPPAEARNENAPGPSAIIEMAGPAKPPAAEPVAPAPKTRDAAADRSAGGERFGGIRVSAPIDLQVFEDGKLLGSTAGPIAIGEGTHSVDVVNDQLSFSSHETVEVKAGQMANLSITLPTSRVSINAVPWADVTVDGTAAGETPIANLSLTIGKHEFVFRHPQLGEQRQTVVAKAGAPTRVTASLQK